MFVLAVQLDEAVGEILERRRGGQGAVDEGAAPALAGQLAPHDDLAAFLVLEDGFYGGQVLAGAEKVLGRAAAEQQAYRLDEDGFAGACLAREYIERRFKFDGHRLDDRQVPDGEEEVPCSSEQ